MNPQPAASPSVGAALLRWEGLLVCLLTVVVFVSVPLAQGGLGLGSDALNHHVYLGWTAQQHRFALPGGEVRSYLQAEMKVYVYDDGKVLYKYYRDLNPVLVGQAQDVLAERARMDCAAVRAALPQLRMSAGCLTRGRRSTPR